MTGMDFPSSPTNGQTTTDGRYYFDSSVGTSGAWRSAPLPVGGLPAGSIMAWGTNTPPANWLLADGTAVSRSTYSSLFAVIGTQYGTGDGTTTFNLPDLRGRVPVGKNGGTFGTLGATGGAETHTLTTAEMPTHGHGSLFGYSGNRLDLGEGPNRNELGGDPGPAQLLSNPGITTGYRLYSEINTSDRGGSQAHNNLQPYQVVNYIIKASAGWTAGDSELATRVGQLEQNPNITGTLTVAGTTTLNGIVKAPNNPSFSAAGNYGALDTAAGALIPFPTQLANKGNCYNTSNSRFTAPVAGTYSLSFSVYRYSGYASQPTFRINGTQWNTGSDVVIAVAANATGDATIGMTMVVPLAAGDYVDICQRTGFTGRYYGGHSFFSGHLIG